MGRGRGIPRQYLRRVFRVQPLNQSSEHEAMGSEDHDGRNHGLITEPCPEDPTCTRNRAGPRMEA